MATQAGTNALSHLAHRHQLGKIDLGHLTKPLRFEQSPRRVFKVSVPSHPCRSASCAFADNGITLTIAAAPDARSDSNLTFKSGRLAERFRLRYRRYYHRGGDTEGCPWPRRQGASSAAGGRSRRPRASGSIAQRITRGVWRVAPVRMTWPGSRTAFKILSECGTRG